MRLPLGLMKGICACMQSRLEAEDYTASMKLIASILNFWADVNNKDENVMDRNRMLGAVLDPNPIPIRARISSIMRRTVSKLDSVNG